MELVGCASCKRHVAIGEVACPFCGAAVSTAKPPRFVPRALSRAAVFAAALTGTACDQGRPTPKVEARGSAAARGDAAVDALGGDEQLRREVEAIEHEIAKPYGAPPARRRRV
jgi:hypothetical protein